MVGVRVIVKVIAKVVAKVFKVFDFLKMMARQGCMWVGSHGDANSFADRGRKHSYTSVKTDALQEMVFLVFV